MKWSLRNPVRFSEPFTQGQLECSLKVAQKEQVNMFDPTTLKDKVVFIVGGTSGINLGIAKGMAAIWTCQYELVNTGRKLRICQPAF